MAESNGGVGRFVFRLFALIVVAAAGVGGWFAYDWLLAEPDAEADAGAVPTETGVAGTGGEANGDLLDDRLLGDDPLAEDAPSATAVGGSAPPWPADLVPATEPWGSFVTSYQPTGGVVRQQMAFDGLTKQTQMKVFDADGVQVGIVEVRGAETWVDEGAGWEYHDVGNGGVIAAGAHADVKPPTLEGLLPATTWPHVTLVSDVADPERPGVRRLGFEIDAAAFSAADPMSASEWREDLPTVVENNRETWFVDVDAAGHIVRLEVQSQDIVVWFSELVQPILFTSPLTG